MGRFGSQKATILWMSLANATKTHQLYFYTHQKRFEIQCVCVYVYIYMYICRIWNTYRQIQLEVDRFHLWLSKHIFGGNGSIAFEVGTHDEGLPFRLFRKFQPNLDQYSTTTFHGKTKSLLHLCSLADQPRLSPCFLVLSLHWLIQIDPNRCSCWWPSSVLAKINAANICVTQIRKILIWKTTMVPPLYLSPKKNDFITISVYSDIFNGLV